MQNDQNRRPGFLESAMGHGTFVVVAIIAVVFVSMVLHLLWNGRRDRKRALRTLIRYAMALGYRRREGIPVERNSTHDWPPRLHPIIAPYRSQAASCLLWWFLIAGRNLSVPFASAP